MLYKYELIELNISRMKTVYYHMKMCDYFIILSFGILIDGLVILINVMVTTKSFLVIYFLTSNKIYQVVEFNKLLSSVLFCFNQYFVCLFYTSIGIQNFM